MPKNTSIILGDHFDAFVASQVEAGRYRNATDVIRSGRQRTRRSRPPALPVNGNNLAAKPEASHSASRPRTRISSRLRFATESRSTPTRWSRCGRR